MEIEKKQALLHQAFFATVIVNGCIALADLAAGLFFVFEGRITGFLYFYHYPFSSIVQAVVLSISPRTRLWAYCTFSACIVKITLFGDC